MEYIHVPEITHQEFEKFISGGYAVLDFFSESNMDCLMMEPFIEALHEEYHEKINVARVNIEDNKKIVEKFQIFKIPCILIFKEGEILEKIEECVDYEGIRICIQKHLKG